MTDNQLDLMERAKMNATVIEHASRQNCGISVCANEGAPPESVAEAERINHIIDEYLSVFAAPTKSEHEAGIMIGDTKCLKCGETLRGFLGSFRWGVVHGEGFCSGCSWPCRAYHTVKDADGKNLFNGPLIIILQYHPDFVQERKVEDEQT